MKNNIKTLINKNNFYKTVHHLKEGNFSFVINKAKQILKDNFLSERQQKSTADYEDIFTFLFTQNNQQDKAYKPFIKHNTINDSIHTIAFYLPQFHPIKENDENWGKGFTEWTNVSKAVPQFYGHYQPKLPGELGFYDLRLKEIRHRQIELAKNYGIDGFCFHFYWFNGKRVLEKPLEDFVADKTHDFSFCINWANENWTRRWDGLESDILLEQNYCCEDDIEFIKNVSVLFQDPRYIRIDDKPLLMIYRVSLFPNIQATVERWRTYCRENGIGEIYLVLTHSFEHTNPEEIGFDAAVEFSPNTFSVPVQNSKQTFYNQNYNGMVFDYNDAINHSLSLKKPEYKKFKTVFPSWDNEARKPGKGTSFINSTPKKYEIWLKKIYRYTKENFPEKEQLVFINAWNEWAEGAYLEPDRKFGYAYLEATYNAKFNYDIEKRINVLNYKSKIQKRHKRAAIIHLYYFDLWDEISSYLKSFNTHIDIFINISQNTTVEQIDKILTDFPNAYLFVFENKGRDILPFIKIMKIIQPMQYDYIYKLHSKKSPHRKDGAQWRTHLIASLIQSKESVKRCENVLRNKDTGLVIAKGNKLLYKEWIGSNEHLVKKICQDFTIEYSEDFYFPAGSIFCFKPIVFDKLLQYIDENDFHEEEGQVDGTMAHAIERVVGLLLRDKDLNIEEI